ncbi:MAG: peptide chain release factor N(5)-glutamine methyltransferase [Candidatus Omnitrophica bacterium]|nr:peptide chain release factor N(5)-glutamine methyltransferase [Candidatus Omnitrophota bacterium]
MQQHDRHHNLLERSSIGALVAQIARQFEEGGVQDARRDAEILLMGLLGCKRSELYLKDFSVEEDFLKTVGNLCQRRLKKYPIAHLLGIADFMGLDYEVNPSVLIPRPETEVLVTETIRLMRRKHGEHESILVADIGTGCGNIAVTLAKTFPESKVYATDISKEALEVAKRNAQRHGVARRIHFLLGDMFADLDGKVDFIVSNPPYIPTDDLEHLPVEVKREPRASLNGGFDGMMFHKRLIRDGAGHLEDGGYLLMEVGIHQAQKVIETIEANPSWRWHYTVSDYHDIERVVVSQMRLSSRTEDTAKSGDYGQVDY